PRPGMSRGGTRRPDDPPQDAPTRARLPPRPLTAFMEVAGVVVRCLYTTGAVTLVGAFASLVFVVRPAARAAGDLGRERLPELDRRLLALGKAALVVTPGAGVLDLWRPLRVAAGVGLRESLEGGHVLPVLLDTHYGTVWLARTTLLVLLAAVLLLTDSADEGWLSLRVEALGLSSASLVLGAM